MELFETIWKAQDEWTYFERVWDTQAKESIVREVKTKPEYFVESSTGTYTYLLDDTIKLQKKVGSVPKDAGVTYGKMDVIQRHIRDYYWNIDAPRYNLKPVTWYIDIETTAYDKIDQINTPEEVVLIQIYDTHKDTMYVLGSRDWTAKKKYEQQYEFPVKYINCGDELTIFEAYFKLLAALKPLLVLGWNTNSFDYPYLYNRCNRLGLDTNRFSYCGTAKLVDKTHLNGGMPSFHLIADGIHYMDYLDIYKKFVYVPRVSYTLDSIAQVELGETKVAHDVYSTFDGFRTGDNYMMPAEEPKDEYWNKMYHLQKQRRENPSPELNEIIRDYANDLFVHYGCIDTYLVKKLDDKLQLSSVMFNISSKMGVTLDASLGTVKPWGSFINNVASTMRKVLPSINVDEDADTSIKGGFVADPQRGKHRWIISVDINSAYPNLSMRGFNMSAETYISPAKMSKELREYILRFFNNEDEEARLNMYLHEPEKFKQYSDLLKRDNVSGSVSGAVFSKNAQGIIPNLVEGIYADRSRQKKEMFQWKQKAIDKESAGQDSSHEKYMQNQMNTQQMVSKILINSLYGALGNKYFQIFNINIARAITSNTRFYIRLMSYRINEKLQQMMPRNEDYIVYNDTDSGYFTIAPFIDEHFGTNPTATMTEIVDWADAFVREIIDPIIESVTKEFSDAFNAFDGDAIKAEREAIADTGVFLAKKKYYLRVHDNEGVRYDEPDLKTMGIEIVRSSTPKFVKDKLMESISIILDSDNAELNTWLDDVKSQFIQQPLPDVAKTASINNMDFDLDVPKFKDGRKVTIPINSRAALCSNKFIESSTEYSHRFTLIKPGVKVKIMYLQQPNPLKQNVFAYTDESFAEMFRDYIDFDTCWEKYFMSSLRIMVEPLGWNVDGAMDALDDW